MSIFSRLKQPQGQQWLVVDKVRVPDIEDLAYTYLPDLTLVHLFAGTPYEHLNEVGPVAIKYTAQKDFDSKLVDDSQFHSSCVLFSTNTPVEQEVLIEHLQALHYVVIDDSPLFFRFYSVMMWDSINSADINEVDIDTILGPFNSLSWISNSNKKTIFKKGKDKDNKINYPYLLTSKVFKELV
ncbi:DUF4123 domain-containing protein [Vibrio palustris]|uniref:DUF4123 domain-containing protein n=1 Tax=Vibrio palustris TaxID=1918946 RepID=A0A1R4B668_9VIBR|nr:DUF4123 domain-containing protein [Vibrio palustris]SJL84376.1 hypothetical protein VPAL9027_02359 [Vibrio palustris]